MHVRNKKPIFRKGFVSRNDTVYYRRSLVALYSINIQRKYFLMIVASEKEPKDMSKSTNMGE